jgi:hypothetical protein
MKISAFFQSDGRSKIVIEAQDDGEMRVLELLAVDKETEVRIQRRSDFDTHYIWRNPDPVVSVEIIIKPSPPEARPAA